MSNINERRKKLEDVIKSGAKLTEEQLIEAVILMSFRDDGQPRDFQQKELRELVQKYEYFKEVFNEGFDN
jgi:hypothetical protein